MQEEVEEGDLLERDLGIDGRMMLKMDSRNEFSFGRHEHLSSNCLCLVTVVASSEGAPFEQVIVVHHTLLEKGCHQLCSSL